MADDKTATMTEETRDDFKRVLDLECALTKTRDALRVIARALGDVAERHAGAEAWEPTQEDVSTLYGAVSLIEYVADECDRAYWGQHEPI